MEYYNLGEEIWSKLLSRLNGMSGIYTGNDKNLRRFIEAVFWVMRTGAQWNELPCVYGRYRSVHKRFDAWSAKGIWNRLFEYLPTVMTVNG